MRLFIKIFLSFLLIAICLNSSYGLEGDEMPIPDKIWPDCEGGVDHLNCGDHEVLKDKVVDILNDYISELLKSDISYSEKEHILKRLQEKAYVKYVSLGNSAFVSHEGHYTIMKDETEYKKYLVARIVVFYTQNIGDFNTVSQNMESLKRGFIIKKIKELEDKFSIHQTVDHTFLKYDVLIAHSWSHSSKENPFIWDEGCDSFAKQIIKSLPRSQAEKQELWSELPQVEQQECLREYYLNTVSVEKVDDRFYLIKKQYYEASINFLYDAFQNTSYTELGVGLDEIVKIETGKSGIFIQHRGSRGNEGGVLFINNTDYSSKKLFKNTDLPTNNIGFVELISFELLVNKQVKFTYKGQDGKILQQIISID